MEGIDDGELVFENDIYVITVRILTGEVLRVEAEQKSNGALWRGDFSSGYIEEITKKTGNCKKFCVFVKMLRSAILQDSDSVFVSLLTYDELEVLKARKTNSTQAPKESVNNKRYLILTYVGEFDRVHYPLPLLFEDLPEPENLRRTIQRLKLEMEDMKSKILRKKDAASPRSEFSEPIAQEFEAEKTLLVKEILSWKSKYKSLVSKYESKKDCHKDSQIWRKRVEHMQEELRREKSNHKRAMANMLMEKMTLLEEVRQSRDGETRARVKLRESESELEHLKRKIRATSTRDLPPSRTRTRAPGTTSNSRRPSPPQHKDYRSSSCPTFSSKRLGLRDGGRQTFMEQYLPRCAPRGSGRRSPLPSGRQNRGSTHSSCSERSGTPPRLQTIQDDSCMASPERRSRHEFRRHKSGLPSSEAEPPQKIRKERHDSPGKLLKDVKEKLAKYAIMESLECRSNRSSLITRSEAEDEDVPSTTDISDRLPGNYLNLEARIEALQNFLNKK